MRTTLTFAAAVLAVSTAACDSRAVRSERTTRTEVEQTALRKLVRLDCPETAGDLKRVVVSPDGARCDYAGGGGSEVTLALTALAEGGAEPVLDTYRRELSALVPERPGETGDTVVVETDGETVPAEGKTHVRLPGIEIHTEGDNAQVRIGNAVHIDADEQGGVVRVDNGRGVVNVRGDEDRAEITANGSGEEAVRSTYILTDDDPRPDGYRLVGYEARGPVAGPIVVATIKSRQRDNDDAIHAMKRLVERNVGA